MGLLGGIGSFAGNAIGDFSEGLFGKGPEGNLRKLFMQMQRDQNLQYTRALGYGLQGQRALGLGFDSALKEVEGSADAARLDVLDSGARFEADLGQGLARSGLSNTTIRGNAMGAAKGMQSRALATVNQNVSQAKAGILAQKGMAQAGGFGNLANMMMGQGQSQTALQKLLWDRLASQPSPQDQFWQLLAAAGKMAAMGSGGGAGAGATSYTSGGPFPGSF